MLKDIEYTFESCRLTRKIAAQTLYTALSTLLSGSELISEVSLRNAWLNALRRENAILPDGWYVPPPHGIAVLFGNEDNERLNYDSLRSEEIWPREDHILDRDKGLLYAYASPVHKETGMIGDFGITLYFGSNPTVCNLLKTTLKINRDIKNSITSKQKLSDVYHNAETLLGRAGCRSNVRGVSSEGRLNIGHTVPVLSKELMKEQQETIASTISHARVFISDMEDLKIQNGMAFTIEPRPRFIEHPQLPMVSYHTICLVHEGGSTELLEDFDDLFRLANMEYMLENL